MSLPDSYALWLTEHTVAILEEMATDPKYLETVEMAGRLEALAIATEDQEAANLIEAASLRLLEQQQKIETHLASIDRLRSELKFYIDARAQ